MSIHIKVETNKPDSELMNTTFLTGARDLPQAMETVRSYLASVPDEDFKVLHLEASGQPSQRPRLSQLSTFVELLSPEDLEEFCTYLMPKKANELIAVLEDCLAQHLEDVAKGVM